jgi:hypothetical protein
VKLNTHLHLQSRLRMDKDILLLPVCDFMFWTGRNLTFFIVYMIRPHPKIKVPTIHTLHFMCTKIHIYRVRHKSVNTLYPTNGLSYAPGSQYIVVGGKAARNV